MMRCSDLEHLLGCLAAQKFINDVNADVISRGKRFVDKTRRAIQRTIDDAYRQLETVLRS